MTEQTGNNKPNEAEGLAFPLSGNEKLIDSVRDWPTITRMSHSTLEVAENALTPTDDERIVRASIHRDVDAIRALGRLLRRSEVSKSSAPMPLADDPMRAPFQKKSPEPQGEPSNRVIVMCARCGLFPVVVGDEINSDIVVCDRCAFAEGRESAQGEPSDAQVLAGLNAFYAPDGYPGQTLADWSEGSVRAMRAALRAAGEVDR